MRFLVIFVLALPLMAHSSPQLFDGKFKLLRKWLYNDTALELEHLCTETIDITYASPQHLFNFSGLGPINFSTYKRKEGTNPESVTISIRTSVTERRELVFTQDEFRYSLFDLSIYLYGRDEHSPLKLTCVYKKEKPD